MGMGCAGGKSAKYLFETLYLVIVLKIQGFSQKKNICFCLL